MSKSRISLLNALTGLLQIAIVSIVGLLFSKCILNSFGSDYNGINSTVNQLVSTIMVLEGGFTLASNVALFKPFGEHKYEKVNGILSATTKRFYVVGFVALIIGTILAFVYPLMLDTTMPYWTVVLLIFSILLPSCYNLGISMKYRVLILTEQKEYIISLITMITYLVGNGIAILAMRAGVSLLGARVIIMLSLFINYWTIGLWCKIQYKFLDCKVPPLFDEIKGTKSVLVLKLTSMVYNSVPIVVISLMPNNGTMLASVYAVYKSVTYMIRNCLTTITNAPRLGFGTLFSENKTEEAKELFYIYEMIVCMGIAIILGVTCLLIVPFVDLYTRGITDIEYHNILVAFIMLLTVFVEVLHMPSGQMIQMAGKFDEAKKIQSVACVVLILTMIVGGFSLGMYGILLSILAAAVVLAILEISYTSKILFHRPLISFIKNMIPSLAICGVGCVFGFSGVVMIESYAMFFLMGLIAFVFFTIITVLVFFVVDRNMLLMTIGIAKKTLAKWMK